MYSGDYRVVTDKETSGEIVDKDRVDLHSNAWGYESEFSVKVGSVSFANNRYVTNDNNSAVRFVRYSIGSCTTVENIDFWNITMTKVLIWWSLYDSLFAEWPNSNKVARYCRVFEPGSREGAN